MDKFDPKKLDDEHLDALIRDIDVPQDIHDQLSRIPHEINPGSFVRPVSQKKKRVFRRYVSIRVVSVATIVALVLVGMCVYLVWPPGPIVVPQAKTDGASAKINGTNDVEAGELDELKQQAEQIRKQMVEASETMNALIGSLGRRRKELELAQSRLGYVDGIELDDVKSLINAVSQHSQISFGSKKESAIRDLSFVIEQFPESSGSSYAKKIIDQLNQSH